MEKPKQTPMYLAAVIIILSTMYLTGCKSNTTPPPTDTPQTDVQSTDVPQTDTTSNNETPMDAQSVNPTTPTNPQPANNTNNQNIVNFMCENNKTIQVTFLNNGSTELSAANVSLSDGRVFTLQQTPSAGGVRYATPDEKIIFWNKGNIAWIEENQSQTYTNCVESGNNTTTPTNPNNPPTNPTMNNNQNTQIANPASEFCVSNGGKLEIKNFPAGQYGICYFDDGRACEEWSMMRGECQIGGVKTTGYDNEAQMLCVWMGGETKAEPNAQCTFKNGKVCPVDDLYNSKCNK